MHPAGTRREGRPCTGRPPRTLSCVPAASAGGCQSSSPQREAPRPGSQDSMLSLLGSAGGGPGGPPPPCADLVGPAAPQLSLLAGGDLVAGPEEADVEVVAGVDLVDVVVVDGDHHVVAATTNEEVRTVF